MTSEQLLNRLLAQYAGNFDIEREYPIAGYNYSALASFNATSAKYVLVKRAELWRAHCYEYILFDTLDTLDKPQLDRILGHIKTYVEPQLVRGGERYPEKDHMYTYMTVMVLCDHITEDARRELEKAKLYINYKFAIRGYSELRLIAVETTSGKIITNKAAKKFKGEIKKLF